MSILKLTNVSTGYGKKQVLHNVSLEVQEGESLLIVGSNGSGKSTLLKAIYGLLNIWEGGIEYNGSLLHDNQISTATYKFLDMGIMYVPQKNALFEDMNVEENLQSSLLHLNDNQEIKKRISQVLVEMPELDKRRKQLAGRLSGGERKMLSLAMVIANKPKLLLYDEPLAGVSEDNTPTITFWLNTIRRKGTTMIIVEHRIKELMGYASKIVGLKLGELYVENFNTLDNIINVMV